MKTMNRASNPLNGLVNSSQATIHHLTDQMRATAERPRQLLDMRRRNDLFRELGQLHYDAHRTGNAPHQSSVNRLTAQLDITGRGQVQPDHQLDRHVGSDEQLDLHAEPDHDADSVEHTDDLGEHHEEGKGDE